jgi:hypothetical protein
MSRAAMKTIRVLAVILLSAAASRDGLAQNQSPRSLGFTRQFVIEIRNPGGLRLENHPVILAVEAIRAFAPDFNSYNYAIFEETAQSVQLVLSQADDLDKDKYHDEIVFVRTLLPSSTVRLTCYYSPTGSFRLMTSARTYARTMGGQGGPGAAWESNLAAFEFTAGRIVPFGKFAPGLGLQGLGAPGKTRPDWGLALLDPGQSAGLGGLSLWREGTRTPLMNFPGRDALLMKTQVLSRGPLRSLVRVEYAAADGGESVLTAFFSAFADNPWSRTDLLLGPAKTPGGVFCGPGLEKLGDGTFAVDEDKGCVSEWGRGADGAGGIGLAAMFDPAALAGLSEDDLDRWVQLKIPPDGRRTFWLLAGWEKGTVVPLNPPARNWARRVADTAAELLAPVEVRYSGK